VSLIRYAEDKAGVASSQRGLQYLMDNINKLSKEYNERQKINIKKTNYTTSI